MKKLIAVILCAAMLCGTTLSVSASIVEAESIGHTVRDESYVLGDADCNGVVNALDANALRTHIVGFDGEISSDAADITADGKITSRDLYSLKLSFAQMLDLSELEGDTPAYKLTVAGNPISDYEIVLNSDFVYDADNSTAAAKLLKGYVLNVCGYELPDTLEKNRTKPHMLRLVRMEPGSAEAEKAGLGAEDYIYEVKNGDLYIYGTLRGLMYAVYEIAEEYLGYRFFDSKYTFVYKHRVIDIPEDTYSEKHVKVKYRYSGQCTSTDSLYSNYFANRLNSTCVAGGNDARNGYQYGALFDNAHSFLSLHTLGTGYDTMLQEGYDDEYIKKNLWTALQKGTPHEYTWEPCGVSFGEESEYAKIVHGMFLVFDMYTNMGYNVEGIIKANQLVATVSHGDNTNGCTCTACHSIMTGGDIKLSRVRNLINGKYCGEYTLSDDGTRVQFKKEGFAGLYLNFTNQAARELKKVYPTLDVFTINYDHAVPETVRPDENVIIFYCGHGCIQHSLGTGECGDNLTSLNTSNKQDEVTLKAWADICHERGSEIWYWSYATNYAYYFLHTPNIKEIYDNWQYLINYCGFDGIYFEGQTHYQNFEKMKSYLSNQLTWNPDMTYEEYLDIMKEYLYMYYGSSEELYQYLMMLQEAGDITGRCFITNHDRPFDMYSWQYLDAHYEEMRNLLFAALEKAKSEEQRERVELLICSCEFMGLSSSYARMYKNGDAGMRKTYEERYTAFFNYCREHAIVGTDAYEFPKSIDFTVSPLVQIYKIGAWSSDMNPPT